MKKAFVAIIFLLSIGFNIAACDKGTTTPGVKLIEHTIQFVLYTNEDFSDDEHTISFSVFTREGNKVLLDSPIATMKVKEIPSATDKIIIEKKILTHSSANLVAGFVYEIKNVGVSWYLDTISATHANKTVEFAFR